MDNKYFCQICHSVFSQELECVNHIIKNHVKIYESKTHDVAHIYDELKKEFPYSEINIKEGSGWYAEYQLEIIKDGAKIKQHLGNARMDGAIYDEMEFNPNSIADAIKDIKTKFAVIDMLMSDIKAIGNFEELRCKGFFYGYSKEEHSYDFEFLLPYDDEYITESYYPWNTEDSIEKFLGRIKQYFVDVLEGEWEKLDYHGYFDGYKINGIDIDGLLKRAKKVKLEIVEYRGNAND